MDFRRGPRPRDYLSRREQRRLLLIVMALGVIVILVMHASTNRNWRWPAAFEPPPKTQPTPPGPALGTVPFDHAALTVDRAMLQPIEDDTTFRSQEKVPWFALLAILQKADAPTVERSSRGSVTYTQLSRQSDAYRGSLVTVRGTMRRAAYVKAPRNDQQIAGYWQTWIESEDGSEPIVAYLLEWPEGIAAGPKMAEDVTITGFYFKQWAYLAADGVRVAPVVLAKTVGWQPPPATAPEPPASRALVAVAIVLAAGMSLVATAYIYLRTRRRPQPTPEAPVRVHAIEESSGPKAKEG